MRFTFSFILSFLFFTSIKAQDIRPSISLEDYMEQIFNDGEEDIPHEEFYDQLYQIYHNPINLNTATREQLDLLFFLSEQQKYEIIQHKEKSGPWISVYELQTLSSFPLYQIQRILPFVTVSKYFTNQDRHRDGLLQIYFSRPVETARGYISTDDRPASYIGTPARSILRFKARAGKYHSLGLVMEKDPGEAFVWQPGSYYYGTDHISVYWAINCKRILKSLIIGDYQMQFGQGLVLGAGFYPGKTSETITGAKRSNTGSRPYNSIAETGFFRGISAVIGLTPSLRFSTFYSNQLASSSQRQDSSGQYITAFHTSGYHRTENEMAKRKNFRKRVVGGNISYSKNNFHIGSTMVYSEFSIPFEVSEEKHKINIFAGSANSTMGIDYSWRLGNVLVFGEGAKSQNGGTGLVSGLISSLGKHVDLSFIYRNYSPNFQSLYSRAFGEYYRNNNERGFYYGISIKASHKLSFYGFYDFFQFMWLKYQVSSPSEGNHYMAGINYNPKKKIFMSFNYRKKVREKDLASEATIRTLGIESRSLYSGSFSYQASPVIHIKSRIGISEYIDRLGNISSGFAMATDIELLARKLTQYIGITFFDTEDYNSRIFLFEKNLPSIYSLNSFYGKGSSTYYMVRLNISPHIKTWFRWNRLLYIDRITIGSGNDMINGNIRNQLSFQVIYRL